MIVHEYGHSLQDQAVPNFAAASRGRLDGRGLRRLHGRGDVGPDRPAAARVRHLHLRLGRDLLLDDSTCGRRADNADRPQERPRRKCEGDRSTASARSGRATLFELRAALGDDTNGQSIMDRVVLESNFMLADGRELRGRRRALLAADQLLYARRPRAPRSTRRDRAALQRQLLSASALLLARLRGRRAARPKKTGPPGLREGRPGGPIGSDSELANGCPPRRCRGCPRRAVSRP